MDDPGETARLHPLDGGDLLLSRAVDRLRDAILRGEFALGDKLSVPDLARILQVSRTQVREALYALERSGLVEMRPRRGAVVFGGGVEELRALFELREALDGMAARLAATRMTDAERAVLRQTWERHDRALVAGAMDDHIALDIRFPHPRPGRRAQRAADREPRPAPRPDAPGHEVLVGDAGRDGTRHDHYRIAEALLAGDVDEGETAARRHVRNVAAFVLRTEQHSTTEGATV